MTEVVAELLSEATDDEVAEIVEAVISSLTEEKSIDELTEEDKTAIAAVVSAVIENGITQEVAETLASNAAVLASVDAEQAKQVFEQVDAGSLTAEVAEQIVDAVQEAPAEIREAFEEVVDLFEGAFDNYKMLGQTISVGERRTVAAVTALAATTAGAAMAAGSSSPGSSGGGGSSGSSSAAKSNDAARKEEEEEEPAGELAGDGVEWIKKIRIFKYENGVKTLNWKAFFTKLVYGIFNSGWTISGALILFLTLSGTLQTIAGVASVIAFAMAMYLHMKEPE